MDSLLMTPLQISHHNSAANSNSKTFWMDWELIHLCDRSALLLRLQHIHKRLLYPVKPRKSSAFLNAAAIHPLLPKNKQRCWALQNQNGVYWYENSSKLLGAIQGLFHTWRVRRSCLFLQSYCLIVVHSVIRSTQMFWQQIQYIKLVNIYTLISPLALPWVQWDSRRERLPKVDRNEISEIPSPPRKH